MKIRQLQAEEFEPSVSLSEYAFQYKLSPEDKEKQRAGFKPERIWGRFNERNELEAKLTLLPLEVYVQGKPVPMGGIAGVSTWPEKRRNGHVSALLTHVLDTMRKDGKLLSLLHPFLVPFYRRFGWELFCDTKKYTLPLAKFPAKASVPGSVRRGGRDIGVLDGLYRSFAAAYNGTLVRSEEWWSRSVFDAEMYDAVYYDASGCPQGYALYKIKQNELLIDEFVFANEEARSGLWNFFSDHDSMITSAVVTMVPADDQLPYMLPDPRIKQENHPYFMARIVDVAAFVDIFEFVPDRAGSITVAIEDRHAPWNSGFWKLEVNAAGKGNLTPGGAPAGTGTEANADVLTLSVGTLTALLLGYKTAGELRQAGQLKGGESPAQWLGQVVPAAQPALFDFF